MKQKIIQSIILISFLSAVLLIPSLNIRAHSPSSMSLSYNDEEKFLTITIIHTVSDETTHFIEDIIIEKNGVVEISENYDNQPTTSEFTKTFNLTANDGDEITVTANCNLAGSISKTLTIGEPTDTQNNNEDTINAFPLEAILSIMLTVSFGIIIHYAKRRKN